jgi:hypothetical protein
VIVEVDDFQVRRRHVGAKLGRYPMPVKVQPRYSAGLPATFSQARHPTLSGGRLVRSHTEIEDE